MVVSHIIALGTPPSAVFEISDGEDRVLHGAPPGFPLASDPTPFEIWFWRYLQMTDEDLEDDFTEYAREVEQTCISCDLGTFVLTS